MTTAGWAAPSMGPSATAEQTPSSSVHRSCRWRCGGRRSVASSMQHKEDLSLAAKIKPQHVVDKSGGGEDLARFRTTQCFGRLHDRRRTRQSHWRARLHRALSRHATRISPPAHRATHQVWAADTRLLRAPIGLRHTRRPTPNSFEIAVSACRRDESVYRRPHCRTARRPRGPHGFQ